MAGFEDLMAAAQGAGVRPQAPSGPAMMAPQGAAAPVDPTAQLTQLLSGVAASPQGGDMLSAITKLMGGMGNNTGATDPRSRFAGQMPSDPGNVGAKPMGASGPTTDGQLADMDTASNNMRSDLPKRTGNGDPEPMSTEDELADVQKRMGDPSADGAFPTRAEIKALNAGDVTPQEFDKKWGKGAAAEMMDEADPESKGAGDDGDHEYR